MNKLYIHINNIGILVSKIGLTTILAQLVSIVEGSHEIKK